MRQSLKAALPVLIAGLLLAAPSDAGAEADHDRARDALRAGRVLPLGRIVENATRQFGGAILNVEVEEADVGFRYELKLMAADGRR